MMPSTFLKALFVTLIFSQSFCINNAAQASCLQVFSDARIYLFGTSVGTPPALPQLEKIAFLADVNALPILDNADEAMDLVSGNYRWIAHKDRAEIVENVMQMEREVIFADVATPDEDIRFHQVNSALKEQVTNPVIMRGNPLEINPFLEVVLSQNKKFNILRVRDLSIREAEKVSAILGQNAALSKVTVPKDFDEAALDRVFYAYLRIARDGAASADTIAHIEKMKADQEMRIKSLAMHKIFEWRILPDLQNQPELRSVASRLARNLARMRGERDIHTVDALLSVVDTLSGSSATKAKVKSRIREVWTAMARISDSSVEYEYPLKHEFAIAQNASFSVSGQLHVIVHAMEQSGQLEIVDTKTTIFPLDFSVFALAGDHLTFDQVKVMVQRFISI